MAATLRRRGCRLFDHAQFAEPLRDEIRHHFGRVLRIETTVNDVTFFKPHRWVEHRDGTRSMPWASVRKTLYRLGVPAELLGASNRRYLEFVSAWDLPGVGIRAVEKDHRTYTYSLTRLGQRVVACTLRLRATVALPALAGATSV